MKTKSLLSILLLAFGLLCPSNVFSKPKRPDSKLIEDSLQVLAQDGNAEGIKQLCYDYLLTKSVKDTLSSADYKCREMLALIGVRTGNMNDVYESLDFFVANPETTAGDDYSDLIETLSQKYADLVGEDYQRQISEGWYVSTLCDDKGTPELIAHIYQSSSEWQIEVIRGCKLADDAASVSLKHMYRPVPVTMNMEGDKLMAVYGAENFNGANEFSAQMLGALSTSLYNSGRNLMNQATSTGGLGTGFAISSLGLGLAVAAHLEAQAAKVTQRVTSFQMNNNNDGTLNLVMKQFSRVIYPNGENIDSICKEFNIIKLYPHNSGLLYSKPLKSFITYRGPIELKDKKAVNNFLQLYHPCAHQSWFYSAYKKVKFPYWSLPTTFVVYFPFKYLYDKKSTSNHIKNKIVNIKKLDLKNLNSKWYLQWAWENFFENEENLLEEKTSYYCLPDGTIMLGQLKKDGTPKENTLLFKRTKDGSISCEKTE